VHNPEDVVVVLADVVDDSVLEVLVWLVLVAVAVLVLETDVVVAVPVDVEVADVVLVVVDNVVDDDVEVSVDVVLNVVELAVRVDVVNVDEVMVLVGPMHLGQSPSHITSQSTQHQNSVGDPTYPSAQVTSQT